MGISKKQDSVREKVQTITLGISKKQDSVREKVQTITLGISKKQCPEEGTDYNQTISCITLGRINLGLGKFVKSNYFHDWE
jgi:hypothetical protein